MNRIFYNNERKAHIRNKLTPFWNLIEMLSHENIVDRRKNPLIHRELVKCLNSREELLSTLDDIT